MESSENGIKLLSRVIEDGSRKPNKRMGSTNTEFAAKKAKPEKTKDKAGFIDDLTDDKQPQQSVESPDNSQILSGESIQNSLFSTSDINHTAKRNFSRGSEKRVLNPDVLCVAMKKLKLREFEPIKLPQDDGTFVVNQPLISNAESSLLEKSENLSPVKDQTITDSCVSDSSTTLLSLRNGLQSDLIALPDESNQIKPAKNKDQLCSVGNSEENFKEQSSFNPNDAFRVLFGLEDDDESDGFSCEKKIFGSNIRTDALSEDELIFRALRNVFKKKLKNFTSQTESLYVGQTFDEGEFKNIKDCSEMDIFEDRHNDTWSNSNSTSLAQCKELETTEYVACPSMSSTNGSKEKKCTVNSPSSVSFKVKDREQLHVGKITKAVECFKSCSSGKEDSPKRRSDDSDEMEKIPSLLSFHLKSGPETMIKRLTKHRKINPLEANHLLSF